VSSLSQAVGISDHSITSPFPKCDAPKKLDQLDCKQNARRSDGSSAEGSKPQEQIEDLALEIEEWSMEEVQDNAQLETGSEVDWMPRCI
jgi:hypothetical protein